MVIHTLTRIKPTEVVSCTCDFHAASLKIGHVKMSQT